METLSASIGRSMTCVLKERMSFPFELKSSSTPENHDVRIFVVLYQKFNNIHLDDEIRGATNVATLRYKCTLLDSISCRGYFQVASSILTVCNCKFDYYG